MTYEEFINNILETRGRFACGEEYHERHHIIPKCIGGRNEEENLIDLFAREHFEAHRLLALENPDNNELTYAWSCMAHAKRDEQERYKLTASEYEEVRIAFSKSVSGENNPNYGKHLTEEIRKKMSDACKEKCTGKNHPMYGKHHTEETKQKISDANSGENNPFYGKHHTEETKKKLSDVLKGENHPLYGTHRSEETKNKISNSNKGKKLGENNPMYGKHLATEVKQKLSEAKKGENNPNYGKHASEEIRKKMSKSHKGENNSFYGKKHTEEAKRKMSESHAGKYNGEKNPRDRKVAQYDLDWNLIRVWDYIKQAGDELGISRANISSCCTGRQKTAGRYHWKYIDNKVQ